MREESRSLGISDHANKPLSDEKEVVFNMGLYLDG